MFFSGKYSEQENSTAKQYHDLRAKMMACSKPEEIKKLYDDASEEIKVAAYIDAIIHYLRNVIQNSQVDINVAIGLLEEINMLEANWRNQPNYLTQCGELEIRADSYTNNFAQETRQLINVLFNLKP